VTGHAPGRMRSNGRREMATIPKEGTEMSITDISTTDIEAITAR